MFGTNFGTLDWGIVILYLVGTGFVGVYVNRYIHNVGDYMVGGRAAGTSLNVATFIGTGLGLVTVMYASIDAFNRGFSYLALPVINVVGALIIGTTGLVIKRLRAMNLTTITEFFEHRFDKKCRVAAGAICALAGILNMGLFPKMGATFITYATGLAQRGDAAVIVNLVTTALIVLVLLYTVMGGMVSVIVTDYIQFVVLGLGLLLGLYFAVHLPQLGGWNGILNTVGEMRGAKAFNPVHGDSYGWMFIIWMIFNGMVCAVGWAPEASRALTSKDPETTRRTFLVAVPGQFARLAIPAVIAIAAYCFFVRSPELSAYFFPDGPAETSPHAAQALPLFLAKIVPTGFLGLLMAGLLAAFMSTHDSYFLCWSSIIVRDVVAPLRREAMDDRSQIRLTRISIVIIGIFLLVWGVWYPLPESVWTYMAVTGNVYLCGAGIVLVVGIYWKRASSTGAFLTILGGLISLIALVPEPTLKKLIPGYSTPLLSLLNYAFCITLFVIGSLLFPDKPKAAAVEEGA